MTINTQVLILSILAAGYLWAETPLLSPSVHITGIYGTSSADHPDEFAPGGHDPKRKDALILQSAEPSLSLRYGEHLRGFANGLVFSDEQDDLQWEWEEYFLSLANLPGGLEVRGGRMLSRMGFHNPTHLHSWSTVDAPLAHSLFLGEDGLALEGADLSIYMDTVQPTVLTIGLGQRPSHDHEHGHGGFAEYEAYRVMDNVATIGLRRDQHFNDFHKLSLTAYGAIGDNEGGNNSWVAGGGFEYQWRESGFEPGGRALRWRTEGLRFLSDPVAHDEHDHDEVHDEVHADEISLGSWGLSSELTYEAQAHFHPFLRFDYVSDAEALDLSEWFRYTIGMTIPFQNPDVYFRLQGNFDERGDENAQSVWAQVGYNWGSGEVR